MSKFDEVLAQLTPEDRERIGEDFLTGIQTGHSEDIADLTTGHESALADATAGHETALSDLATSHAAEIESVRAEKYENVLTGGDDDAPVLPESYGDDTEEELSFENYWEVAANG